MTRSRQALFLLLIKLLILAVTGVYLYFEIFRSGNFMKLLERVLTVDEEEQLLLWITGGLMLVNWGLEAWKWQVLMKGILRLPFWKAFAAILTGVTVSTWLPNRIGEYVGRVLYLPAKVRLKAIFATVTGSIAQMVVTLMIGSFGGLYLLDQYMEPPVPFWLLIGAVLVANVLLVLLLFNLRKVVLLVPKWKWLRQVRKALRVLHMYGWRTLNRVLLLSVLRYLVFSLQYYLLLLVFEVDVLLVPGMALVAVVFLVQSVVPSVALAELGVRGAVAVAVFQYVSENVPGILSASYSLWLINIIIPSVLGAIVVLVVNGTRKR